MNQKNETIYGIHAVHHLIKQNPDRVLNLWIIDKKKNSRDLTEIVLLSKKSGLNIEHVSKLAMDKHTDHGVHQGVMAKIKSGDLWSEKDLPKIIENCVDAPPLLLILDGVQDPHNLGACIRTANAAGVTAVIIPKDKTVSVTSTVRKVACGAAEYTPIISVTNLSRTIKSLKEIGIWMVGTDSAATQNLYDVDLRPPIAMVMGGEGTGLRKNTRDHCDFLVSFPVHGIVESLNLSVATGVCLYEVLRQRD